MMSVTLTLRLIGYFTGTGDMTTALLTAWASKYKLWHLHQEESSSMRATHIYSSGRLETDQHPKSSPYIEDFAVDESAFSILYDALSTSSEIPWRGFTLPASTSTSATERMSNDDDDDTKLERILVNTLATMKAVLMLTNEKARQYARAPNPTAQRADEDVDRNTVSMISNARELAIIPGRYLVMNPPMDMIGHVDVIVIRR